MNTEDNRGAVQNYGPAPAGDSVLTALKFLTILLRGWKIIVGLTLASAVISVIAVLLMRNQFIATARIMTPQPAQSIAGAFLGQMSGLAGLGGGGLGGVGLGLRNPADVYVAMIGSRTVADKVIERFNLKALNKRTRMDDVRLDLSKMVQIYSDKGGVIVISVSDVNPVRARDMANAFVDELGKLSQNMAVTEASQRRAFLGEELRREKDLLTQAEIELKLTEERTGIVEPSAQGKLMFEGVMRLKAQIAAKQVQLRSMETFATDQNPDYIRTKQELAGLVAELSKAQKGSAGRGDDTDIPTGKIPEAGLDFIRKYRDAKYHETLFESLAKQYELARLDEGRQSVVIQVMDYAVTPDRKAKPFRALICAVSTVLGFAVSVLFVLGTAIVRGMRANPKYEGAIGELIDRAPVPRRKEPAA